MNEDVLWSDGDWDSSPIAIGEFLVPTDPAELTQCDSCQ